jgi:protein ImuB
VDRTACVEVPALPLQLLLQRHPDWVPHPVAVVDRDKPQGVILWTNGAARRLHVRPGMRHAAALSLARTLHAGEVPAPEIRQGVEQLTDRLRRFSPDVEPSAAEPGIFWLAATGLERLHASLAAWAGQLQGAVAELGLRCRVAVGFTRFGSYAAARAGDGTVVFRSTAEEQAALRTVPLRMLGVTPKLLGQLERLGITALGQFLALPAAGLRRRFGAEAHQLHEQASGAAWAPLVPLPEVEPLCRRVDLDSAETDVYRLLFQVKRLLDPLLERLAGQREALVALRLRLSFDHPGTGPREQTEQIRPAAPTLDVRQLMNLVHLRLEALELSSGIAALELAADAVPLSSRQLALFAARPRRDAEAAARALARVRAEFGDQAVVRATLREGHLPEARFGWEPLARVRPARPREVLARPLVRRIAERPVPLCPRPGHEPGSWLPEQDGHGHPAACTGPYVVSGGWWRREVHREYHFVRLRSGEVLWLYHDRLRRRWFRQGSVE